MVRNFGGGEEVDADNGIQEEEFEHVGIQAGTVHYGEVDKESNGKIMDVKSEIKFDEVVDEIPDAAIASGFSVENNWDIMMTDGRTFHPRKLRQELIRHELQQRRKLLIGAARVLASFPLMSALY